MKFYYPFLGIIILLMICSCGKKDTVITPIIYEFQAISLGIGGDCQLCQIKFLANIAKVDSIIGIETPVDSVYYALSLPSELNYPGTLIKLNIRQPLYIEVPYCNYKGKFYNSVYVVNAEKN